MNMNGLATTSTRTAWAEEWKVAASERAKAQVSAASATVTYTLDANGSLTNDGLHEFEYDAANRLSRMRAAQSGEPVTVRYLQGDSESTSVRGPMRNGVTDSWDFLAENNL
jgi:YD repeat-containing protein